MNASLGAASLSGNNKGRKRLNEVSDSENEREKKRLKQEGKKDPWSSNSRAPLVWWIITSLWFFDCAPSEIFRVLQSYDLGGTISDVERHIDDNQLPNYRSLPSIDGAIELPSLGIIGTVYFADQMPVRSVLVHPYIMALTPREIVNATTSDGQIVVMTIRDSEVQSWTEASDYAITGC